MSTTAVETKMCPACENELQDGICVNADCPEAQAVASAHATRETQKTAADTAGGVSAASRTESEPRSFARQGYRD